MATEIRRHNGWYQDGHVRLEMFVQCLRCIGLSISYGINII